MPDATKIKKKYDVVIVGSGPAGAAAGKALAGSGLNVVMLEKRKVPRYKCCAGVLGGETQALVKEYFGSLPPDEVYCTPKVIHADHVYGHDEEEKIFKFLWEWPKEGKEFTKEYLNLWRDKFDYWLAKESGCEIIDQCAFQGCSPGDDGVTITASFQQKEIRLKTRYLIGADGGISRVRDSLDHCFKKTYETFVAYQRYYQLKNIDLPRDHWHIFRNPTFSAAIAEGTVKDDMIRISVTAMKNQEPKEFMEKFITFLGKNYGAKFGRLARTEGCMATNMFVTGNFNLGKGKVVLVGEAAGFMSMNGGGIDTALESGYAAGLSVKEASTNGKKVLDIYNEKTVAMRSHIAECVRHIQLLHGEDRSVQTVH